MVCSTVQTQVDIGLTIKNSYSSVTIYCICPGARALPSRARCTSLWNRLTFLCALFVLFLFPLPQEIHLILCFAFKVWYDSMIQV
ncbi:hypothetical protein BDR03DRAFT_692463 [Suillus americanus]|nr:hypothetical protein BDR03DRAFT_692463 [Suillus americanus]